MQRSEFGPRLRDLRVRAGLTIEALAEASGVSVRAISDTERGRSRAPQPRTVAALAAGLGLAPADTEAFTELGRSGRETTVTAGRPRSCELPRRSVHFVGRDAELAVIGRRVAAGSAKVTVLYGPPGVGKTALAIRVAEQHRDRFPDGCYYLDLRGTEPEPVTTGDALTVLLKALGVHSRQVARDEDERAGQLRALLAGRRCLLILDNAGGEAQVRGLLPGGGANCVLVTSRRALGGLEAVRRHPIASLRPEESAALLESVGGGGGTAEATATLAQLCGHLPLALHIAGTRLAGRGSMADLVAELSDANRRLATLSASGSGVEAAFAVSYAQLAGPARTTFRRLAQVPTVSFAPAAAAVLAGCDVFTAEDQLEELLDLGLLQPEGAERYRFHDLIRLFATDRLRTEEPAEVSGDTARRLRDWYLDTAIAAGRWFEPAYGGPPDAWSGPVPLDTAELAQTWLQVEFDGWVEAMRGAAAGGAHQRVVDVAEALHWYSDRTYSVEPWRVVYTLSRESAALLPDRHQEVTHINYLAWAYGTCDARYEESAAIAMDAYRMAVELGDVKEQANALAYAADPVRHAGRHDEAIAMLERSLALADEAGDDDMYVQTMISVGLCLRDAGRSDAAVAQLRAALTELDRRPLAAAPAQIARLTAWVHLSTTYADAGRWPETVEAARAALPLAETFGEPSITGQVQVAYGEACAALGDTATARDALGAATQLLEDRGNLARWLQRARAGLAALSSA
ncbi:helix-turn-helix domain-containing protein [Dactylosporangium cerinum]|uniref:Helix-turn-helix domain-containing protein n=1 Tax=Dactylosporangium cerinum TaxID=1434730 RepID=A0ABV9VNE4_9ACTN